MGDIADMMLDGTCCSVCGCFLSEDSEGFPAQCEGCQEDEETEEQE
jgi:hypothetical protein